MECSLMLYIIAEYSQESDSSSSENIIKLQFYEEIVYSEVKI